MMKRLLVVFVAFLLAMLALMRVNTPAPPALACTGPGPATIDEAARSAD